MWNWLISVLASKASIVLFDGFPMYKRDDLLIKIANKDITKHINRTIIPLNLKIFPFF